MEPGNFTISRSQSNPPHVHRLSKMLGPRTPIDNLVSLQLSDHYFKSDHLTSNGCKSSSAEVTVILFALLQLKANIIPTVLHSAVLLLNYGVIALVLLLLQHNLFLKTLLNLP